MPLTNAEEDTRNKLLCQLNASISDADKRAALRQMGELAAGLIATDRPNDAVVLVNDVSSHVSVDAPASVRAQSATLLIQKARALAAQNRGEGALDTLAEAVARTSEFNAARAFGLTGPALRFRIELLHAMGRYEEAVVVGHSLLTLARNATQAKPVRRMEWAVAAIFAKLLDLTALGRISEIPDLPQQLLEALTAIEPPKPRGSSFDNEYLEPQLLSLFHGLQTGDLDAVLARLDVTRASREVIAQEACELFWRTDNWAIPGAKGESGPTQTAVSAVRLLASRYAMETRSWTPTERATNGLLEMNFDELAVRFPNIAPEPSETLGEEMSDRAYPDHGRLTEALSQGALLATYEFEFLLVISQFESGGEAIRHRVLRQLAPARIALGLSILSAIDPNGSSAELGLALLIVLVGQALFTAAWGSHGARIRIALDPAELRGFSRNERIVDWLEDHDLPIVDWMDSAGPDH